MYAEIRLELDVAGMRIPAIICSPASKRSSGWAVVLIPGALESDADGNMPSRSHHQHAYADLARQLADRGHHVLRYAKHGLGTGTVIVDASQAVAHDRFGGRLDVARASLEVMREWSDQTCRQFALAGHSEGADRRVDNCR